MDKRKHFRFSNTGNLFLLGFGIFYALSLAWQAIMLVFFRESTVASWISYFINPIAFIGVTVFFARKKKVDFKSATRFSWNLSKKQVLIIALLSIFCIMAFLPITNVFLEGLQRLGFSLDNALPDTDTNIWIFLLSILVFAVAPAFSEEIFIRGGVLNCAEQKRDYVYAILVTAGLFSLMHGSPLQTVHQFLLGIVLAYIVIASGSLWAGILLHFFNNLLSLVLDYPLVWFMNLIRADSWPGFIKYIIWAISMVIGCAIVVMLLKKFTELSKDKIRFNQEEVIDVYPDGKLKTTHNAFVSALIWLGGIFTRKGFRQRYSEINDSLCEVAPLPEPEEPTREDFYPPNIKLAFIVLGILWILALVVGFAS